MNKRRQSILAAVLGAQVAIMSHPPITQAAVFQVTMTSDVINARLTGRRLYARRSCLPTASLALIRSDFLQGNIRSSASGRERT
jgi:hypothetical protein